MKMNDDIIVNQSESESTAASRGNALQLMRTLRNQIEAGQLARGEYMPAVRQLCKTYGAAANTVLRALHMLSDQGLIVSRPRQGFWICEVEKKTENSFVYVMSTRNVFAGFDALYATLMQEFQTLTQARQEHLSTLVCNSGDEVHAIKQHGLSNVTGLILDVPNDVLIERARKDGVPAVLIDDMDEQRRITTVVQDNVEGGALAARHLLASGCKRIAWFGRTLDHHHPRARYGGAASALAEAGTAFALQDFHRMDSTLDIGQMERAARAMLQQRPDGVLVLWRPMAMAVIAAARQLGLTVGVDFQFVGWTCEELFESSYAPLFDGAPPPAVVWSARRMAEVSLAQLRAAEPFARGEAMTTQIPVSLCVNRARAGHSSAAAALAQH